MYDVTYLKQLVSVGTLVVILDEALLNELVHLLAPFAGVLEPRWFASRDQE